MDGKEVTLTFQDPSSYYIRKYNYEFPHSMSFPYHKTTGCFGAMGLLAILFRDSTLGSQHRCLAHVDNQPLLMVHTNGNSIIGQLNICTSIQRMCTPFLIVLPFQHNLACLLLQFWSSGNFRMSDLHICPIILNPQCRSSCSLVIFM